MMLKLDLGCGPKCKAGYVGVDIRAYDGVAFVLDLETQPLPIESGTVDEVYSSHFLEHIADIRNVIRESSRVLRKGGVFCGVVPLAGTPQAFQDPTHVRFYNPSTFAYFDKQFCIRSDLPWYDWDCDFALQDSRVDQSGWQVVFVLTKR